MHSAAVGAASAEDFAGGGESDRGGTGVCRAAAAGARPVGRVAVRDGKKSFNLRVMQVHVESC